MAGCEILQPVENCGPNYNKRKPISAKFTYVPIFMHHLVQSLSDIKYDTSTPTDNG